MELMQWTHVEGYEYEGPVELACGPSGAEGQISGSQQAFYNELSGAFANNYGAQSNIFQGLTSSLTPIMQAGPNQQGFSAGENAALNTAATNTTAANYRNAAVASATGRATAGGGNDYLPSGADKQVQAGIASNAAQNLSQEQNQITQANYSTGRQNYFNALQGLGGVASGLNPTGYANPAISAGNSAFTSANTVQQQKNQEQADIASGIASAASMAIGGFGGFGGGGGSFGSTPAGALLNLPNQQFIGGMNTTDSFDNTLVPPQ